jgi:hypothetical protein
MDLLQFLPYLSIVSFLFFLGAIVVLVRFTMRTNRRIKENLQVTLVSDWPDGYVVDTLANDIGIKPRNYGIAVGRHSFRVVIGWKEQVTKQLRIHSTNNMETDGCILASGLAFVVMREYYDDPHLHEIEVPMNERTPVRYVLDELKNCHLVKQDDRVVQFITYTTVNGLVRIPNVGDNNA